MSSTACGYCGADGRDTQFGSDHCKKCGGHYDASLGEPPCDGGFRCDQRRHIVYFIGTDTHVKIGYTTHSVFRRQAQLQTGNPKKLWVYGVLHEGRDEERRLHEHFAIYREEGEWFRLSDEIHAFIKARCVPGY